MVTKSRGATSLTLHALFLLAAVSCPSCLNTPQRYVSPHIAKIEKNGVITVDDLDINGQWYVYGDAYGNPRSCMDAGGHREDHCSKVTSPSVHLPQIGYPTDGERVCVSGVVARILQCCVPDDNGILPEFCEKENETNCPSEGGQDDSSMWGAGIGFDFDMVIPAGNVRDYDAIDGRIPWDADDHGIVGISFVLDWQTVPEGDGLIPLRVGLPVEFDQAVTLPEDKGTVLLNDQNELEYLDKGTTLPAHSSSEQHPYGSPFWQTVLSKNWGPSPVSQGHNTVLWSDVHRPPDGSKTFPTIEPFAGDNLLGLQFHVIPDKDGETDTPFSFCISDIQFLTKDYESAE